MDNNKEIVEAINNLTAAVKELSSKKEPLEPVDRPERPVWVTFVALGFLITISVGTGFFYWWSTYFRPDIVEQVPVVMAAEGAVVQLPVAAQPTVLYENIQETVAEETYEEDVLPVYEYEPFVATYDYSPVYQPYVAATALPYAQNPTENPVYYDYDVVAAYEPPPHVGVVMDPRPEFVELWEQHGNNTIVARVSIAGTGLDTLVVQAQPSGAWPVFMDLSVDLLIEDQNTVITDSSSNVFRQVLNSFNSYDFFLQNPIISLTTLYEVSRWEVFSFYLAPASFPFSVVAHDNWADAIMQFSMASIYNTRIDVNQNDRVLTLTTPSTNYPGLNYVLQARLYREITS